MCWNKAVGWAQMLALVFVLISCVSSPKENDAPAVVNAVEVTFSVSGNEVCFDTKSILPEETIDTRLTNITLASYDSQNKLINTMYYARPDGTIKVYISSKLPNNIYVVANMGDMTNSFPMDEADVSKMTYVLANYANILLNGIPMCGVLKNCVYTDDESINIDLERMFAKVNVRLLHTNLEGSDIDGLVANTLANKSIYLRQANRRMVPFAEGGSRAEDTGDILFLSDFNSNLADTDKYTGSLSEAEMELGVAYVQDTTIVLYVPENVQGCLLPDNTDPFGKVPESISGINGKEYDKLCTYLEFNASKPNKGDGYYGDLQYRCYLGEDNVSDFSVHRNCSYELTMVFTDAGFVLDSWKVVRGENWVDTRTLYFVDEPFYVYPGETANVLVHYNKYSSDPGLESMGPSADLVYEFDDIEMKKSGLTCTFMNNNMVAAKNKRLEFYFKVVATKTARRGVSFPIKISLKDGTKSDVSSIHIANIGDLIPMWDFTPQYVSQVGNLSFLGTATSLLPLSAKVSDSSVVSCTQTDAKSFRIIGLKEGTTDITFVNSDGSQSLVVPVSIAAPKLNVDNENIVLNPDGESYRIAYYYTDSYGSPLENVDDNTYRQYLTPILSGCDYVASYVDDSGVDVYLDCLNVSGKSILLGMYYNMSISARGCPGVGAQGIKAYVSNPFRGMGSLSAISLNDYTLFGLSGVNSKVKNCFASKLSNVTDVRCDIAPVAADENYISSSLEPVWDDGFSFSCGVYEVDYMHSDSKSSKGASVRITQNSVDANTSHSAGRHELRLHVQNRHSGEKISRSIADVDVYVHTAIGANATFGYKICKNPTGGVNGAPTIAGIYNSVAGKEIYNPSSANRIYYMDVAMEFLTPINKVSLFYKMRSALSSWTNTYDCMDWVTPSIVDGYVDKSQGLFYSVCTTSDQRTLICGETVGGRRGVGMMLYRALGVATYSSALSDVQLLEKFLGYSSSSGVGSEIYAPKYDLHDMNLSTDMTKNLVGKTVPYYFSPKSCAAYRDSSGKGYHVIHTLNMLYPSSCGWVNLL